MSNDELPAKFHELTFEASRYEPRRRCRIFRHSISEFLGRRTGVRWRHTGPRSDRLATRTVAHLNHFKVPSPRGPAAQALYFHNGFAKDLDAAVDFYDQRFHLKLSKQEHSDLVAFLRSL